MNTIRIVGFKYSRAIRDLIGTIVILSSTTTASATSYYVAKTGTDTNPGTFAQPFLTIQRAANSAVAGDQVYVRAGVYRETITPPNSGSAGLPLLFQPYNGEEVTINGADLITGWTQYSGSIWQAPMNWTLGDDQVFLDGEMMTYARWPNTGSDISRPSKAYVTSATASEATPPTLSTGTISDPALTQAFGFWNGATIHIAPGMVWVQQTGTVSTSAVGSLVYTYLHMSNGNYTPTAGNPYYLDGCFNALDAPTEWYRNSTSGTLFLWTPQGDSPALHSVEAKKRSYAFNLSGRSYITVKGFELFGTTIFTDSLSSNIIIDGISAYYVTHFSKMPNDGWGTHIKDTGIVISGSGNQLLNSRVQFSAGSGVTLMGYSHLVNNNLIQDVDYAAIDNAAITTGNSAFLKNSASSNHEISNNTLINCGRSGMVLHGLQGGWIHHNEIYNSGLQMTDCGDIYVYNWDGAQTDISYNLIHEGVVGIYLDNGSTNFRVHHNIVWNSPTALRLNTPSVNNLIYNNTLLSGRAITTDAGAGMTGTVIKNNIVGGSTLLDTGATFSPGIQYWTDPKFVDALSLDFRLSATSPAIDVALLLPPYTNGYVGTLPDFGAREYGATAWTAGSTLATMIPPAPTHLAATQISGTQAALAWQDNSSSETGFQLERSLNDDSDFSIVASLPPNTTSYTDSGLVPGSRYFYRIKTATDDGWSSYSNIAPCPAQWLPSPWSGSDIGTVGLAGSHNYVTNPDSSFYTVKGAGAGIAGMTTADGFHYIYQTLNGDGQIIARITSNLSGGGNVAGVMVRETLAADSKHAALLIGPGSGSIKFVQRTVTGGTSASSLSSPNVSIPYWIRITRSGNVVKSWKSTDRITWSSMGTATIAMSTNVYIGLAVTSGSTTALNTSTFDSVTIAPLPDITKETTKFSDTFTTGTAWSNLGTTSGKAMVGLDPNGSGISAWYPAINSDGTGVTSVRGTGVTMDISQGRITAYVTVRFDRIDGGASNQFVFYVQETGNWRFGELFIRPGTSAVLQYFNPQGTIVPTYINALSSQLTAGAYQKFALSLVKNTDATMTLTAYVWDGNSYLPIGSANGAAYGGGLFNNLGIISTNASGSTNRAYLDSITVTQ